jgi:cytidine deaminase
VDEKELVAVAVQARGSAYAPYSHYEVGAALLAGSGRVYTGCNVENSSFGLTICAERTAAVKAISEGERQFVAVAVVTADGGTPCGACRQVLAEFGPTMRVVIADTAGNCKTYSLPELLPNAFALLHKP